MNDAFAWDVGDLAKFALLRHLTRPREEEDPLRLGTVWCYTRTPISNGTDITRRYLVDGDPYGELLRQRDPELYELMQGGSRTGRPISSAEYRSLLASDTTHVFDLLGRGGGRSGFWQSALAGTTPAAIVFFDPDNGIGNGEEGLTVSYRELKPFYDRGQSLVIYQHQNREKGGIKAVVRNRLAGLTRELGADAIFALRWHRVQARLFFIVAATSHRKTLEARVRSLLTSPWGTVCYRNVPDFSDALPLANQQAAAAYGLSVM